MSELPAPSDRWTQILSDHGIAIVIVLFLLFVVTPFTSFYGVKAVRWLGNLLEEFLERIASTAEQSAKTQEEIKSLVIQGSVIDGKWHDDKTRKLDEIKEGVRGLHDKVDQIKDHVTRK